MKAQKGNISNSDGELSVEESKLSAKRENEQQKCPDLKKAYKTFRQYAFKAVQTQSRSITLTGQCSPPNYQNNIVKNTKFNVITFVPLVLYNQFKFFFNLFFLVTALSQLIQQLRVGLFITYMGPLIMVLSLTMGKQAYDDYRTYRRDIQANSKVYGVVKKDGVHQVKSKDLKIGDIVIINSGDRIPADLLTLYSDNEQGTLFLKTDQLDGETDWKLRKAIKATQNIITRQLQKNESFYTLHGNTKQKILHEAYQKLLDEHYRCEVKPPIGQIYTFDGIFIEETFENVVEHSGLKQNRQKLTLENTLWTSTVLTNGQILGLVTYIGNQTRIALGASTPRTKVGILDYQINFLSKVLFILMVIMTLVILLLQKTEWQYVPIQFTRILILLSSIIPISMRVNLDFAKLFYAYEINNDQFIKGTITRNSNCPEELGRVKYILSDKTGTLTQNQMIFKRISIEDTIKFTDENEQQIKQIISEYAEEDIPQKLDVKEKYLKDIVLALALCHNVTPVYNDVQEKEKSQMKEDESSIKVGSHKISSEVSNSNKVKDFQASSPDQITFVKMVQRFGIQLVSRTQTQITLRMPSSNQITFDILYTFPFSSETKRMGIVIKNRQTNEIIFYLKGADSIMKQFILNRQKKGFIDEQCKDLSMTGLRTLVFSKKVIKLQVFEAWSKRYEQAYNQLDIDKIEIKKLMNQLESGVDFLGITGIEDKLQRRLKSTIESLKSANIKIWMITGDKVQTAQCISRSCGLQKITQENVKIQEIQSPAQWKYKWEAVKQTLSRVLIIDGKTLLYVLEGPGSENRRQDFYRTAMKMPAVICCRCSPQQKRTLTAGIKEFKEEKQAVLGIGDGGNDVGMIQAADIGVGIVGKEGKQAALAADFSILQFKAIKTLLLWHGRLSYKRSALLSSFIIHRGFIVSIIQVIFSCVYFFVSIPVFNSYLQLGYATFFTFWPVFSLILDTDIDKKSALKYPNLYHSLQSSNQLSTINFMSWLWKASVQGTIIMVLGIIFFNDDSYLLIETICFTTLILTQYFMTLSQIHRIHILTIFCVVGSIVCYALCLVFLADFISVSDLNLTDLFFIFLITLISWGPLLVWKLLKRRFFPTDYEKVMKTVKRSAVSKKMPKGSVFSSKQQQQLRQSLLN